MKRKAKIPQTTPIYPPCDIYVVVPDFTDDHEGYGEPLVAAMTQLYAERMMKQYGGNTSICKIQLVGIPEDWINWPTNVHGMRMRALAKLTREEKQVLGLE